MVTSVGKVYEDRYLSMVFKLFGRSFLLPPITFFLLYWVTPLLFVLASSVINWNEGFLDAFQNYVGDKIHLAFAINSSILVFFCYRFVRLLEFRMNDILRNSSGQEIPFELVDRFGSIARFPFSLSVVALATLIAVASSILLFERVLSEQFGHWWGHIANGYGGCAYAVVTTVFIFLSVKYFALLAATSSFLVQFSMNEMKLRPLHPDGSSGLGMFGSMMLSIWAQTLLLSFALLIVIQSNYLGLSENYFIWLLGGVIVVVAPFAAIVPFATAVLHARKLKKLLVSRLVRGSFVASQLCNEADAKSVLDFLDTKARLDTITVFPFLSIKFFAVLGFNAVQLYLAVTSIVTGYSVGL